MKSKVIFLFLISLIFLIGCGGVEPEHKVDVQEEKDKVVVQTEQGKLEVSSDMNKELEVPEGFPADKIPIYPNGNIVVSETFQGGYNLGIVTNDDIKTVHEYYKKNLKVDSITSEMLTAESANIIIQDEEKIAAIIIMQNNLQNDFKYIINITYGE